MSLFKFFSCCLPSRKSKRPPVLDSPVAVLPPTPIIQDVFLLDMPDLVMREILKNLDFLTIQKLRKTSYSLRQFIDYVKVDSGLKDFKIKITGNSVLGSATVLMKGYPSSKTIKTTYIESENGCEVKTYDCNITQQKLNGNFVDVFSEDFLIPMLKNQKSLLTKLQLERNEFIIKNGHEVPEPVLFDKVFDSLMKVLESWDRSLQVEDLEVSVRGQKQLMKLLYYTNLKSLKRLKVCRIADHPIDLKNRAMLDLSVLECAENLNELRVFHFIISSSLRSIAHVPELHVNMHTIYSPCTPHSNSTYLFAYSNDFDNETVLEAAYTVAFNSYYNSNNTKNHFRVFASVRFDTVQDGEIFYNYIGSDFNETVLSHLPDPSLSFPSSETGSDILRVIDGNTYDGLANELDANYLFYAVNPTVSGTGSLILPPALVPEIDPNNNFVYSLLEINIQDHPLDDSFNSLNISFHDVATSNTQTIMYERDNWQFKNANPTFYITSAYIHIGREQQVALSYNYSLSDPQQLQIRMFTKRGDGIQWIPFPN
ncbi:hypothetical protein GCK72_021421 [Caenorhabditis remanei]|uniref:F-box domain-containing protein n=1 Tax=Caenorhabditis remanei TaxID=31234 RepID=A0A6A5GJS8_CAERE|nr:hypothetical protein GCK72_021421 [Caenorhabditis remanei]KAF1754856.1 hypothetical protein GCK72_021421 [Caenorhabditis remanei]